MGASRVRDMFLQGKKHAPCIIFIDEIDAVGRSRFTGIGGGHDEREQTLNALLVEMDGFETEEGVIIVAATNRPDVLDPALLRPGRFDRQIVIDLPTIDGRAAILKMHAQSKKIGEKVEMRRIARGTPGFSGADLANLLNEAALLAAREGKEAVDMKDLEEARDKVRWGRERRSRVLDSKEKRITAYHEAASLRVGIRLFQKYGRTSGGFGRKILLMLESTEREIRGAREAGIYGSLLLLSICVRAFKYGSLYVLLFALVAPLGYALEQLSVPKVFLGLCSAELAASLPISGIAGFGAYEGAWALVFNLLGFERIAEITSISHHLITQVYGYTLGGVALLVLLLPVFKVKQHLPSRKVKKARLLWFITAGAVLLTGAVVLWVMKAQNGMENVSHAAGIEVGQDAIALMSQIRGSVVYEHNGGVFLTEIGTTNKTCVIERGNFPRWSPDGTTLAFVQQNRIMCVSPNGEEVNVVAEAKRPRALAWHPNGEEILFTDGKEIKAVALKGGALRSIVRGYTFRELDLAPDGKRLITTVLKPTRLRAFDLDSGKSWDLSRGCSASLSPDGTQVTMNQRNHRVLSILDWTTQEPLASVSAPKGRRFDNHFWSNSSEWIASMVEESGDIYIHRISTDEAYRMTSSGECDRPDLFVRE